MQQIQQAMSQLIPVLSNPELMQAPGVQELVREFIEKHQPDLCICGHIHESRNKDQIGKTLILNPGSIDRGYVLIHWDGKELKANLAFYT